MSKNKNNVIESPVKAILHKRYCRCQAEMFDESPTVFKCGDVETAVPDRTIPISDLWNRFVRGENIIDSRMSKTPTYNQLEDNPFKKKGLDLADLPKIKADNAVIIENAYAQAQQEIEASKQVSQDVLQTQEVKPE